MRRAVMLTLLCLMLVGGGAFVLTSPYVSARSWASLYSALVAERGIRIDRDVPYGPDPRQTFDVYRPSRSEDGPVVLFFYGGSWRFGEKETYGFVGAALATQGITTVIPNYRLYPEVVFPEFVRDGAAAYRKVAETVAKGTAGSRPIIVMGHSAGAHIAAMLAVEPRYLADAGVRAARPAGLISLAGPLAFDPTTWESTKEIFAPAAGSPDTARPARLVSPDDPPALLMHGVDDPSVRLYNSRDFAKAMREAGVAVRLVELEHVEHIGILLALSRPFRHRAPVLKTVVEFIEGASRIVPPQRPSPERE